MFYRSSRFGFIVTVTLGLCFSNAAWSAFPALTTDESSPPADQDSFGTTDSAFNPDLVFSITGPGAYVEVNYTGDEMYPVGELTLTGKGTCKAVVNGVTEESAPCNIEGTVTMVKLDASQATCDGYPCTKNTLTAYADEGATIDVKYTVSTPVTGPWFNSYGCDPATQTCTARVSISDSGNPYQNAYKACPERFVFGQTLGKGQLLRYDQQELHLPNGSTKLKGRIDFCGCGSPGFQANEYPLVEKCGSGNNERFAKGVGETVNDIFVDFSQNWDPAQEGVLSAEIYDGDAISACDLHNVTAAGREVDATRCNCTGKASLVCKFDGPSLAAALQPMPPEVEICVEAMDNDAALVKGCDTVIIATP